MHHKIFYLFFMIPVFLFSGALERYTIPQQSERSATNRMSVEERVYIKFKNTIQNYTPEQKAKLTQYFQEKMAQAIRQKQFDAAAYYERLINILNSDS